MTGFWVNKWLGESPPNFPCNVKRFWAKMFSGESSDDVLRGNISQLICLNSLEVKFVDGHLEMSYK